MESSNIQILDFTISNERSDYMLATLRDKNQVTIPNKIIQSINLKKDSYLDIELNDEGQIIITPVTMVESSLITELREALDDVKKGNISKAMSADDLINKLGL